MANVQKYFTQFDEAIKLHTRCAVYAYTGFWSSIVAFVIGCILGGLK